MEIRLIEATGVPASELDAHKQIHETFNASAYSKRWHGYASFKLSRGGPGTGDDDFDLVLITHTNIIVIELKNWRGKSLVSKGGNWFVDGQPRGRSPVSLVNLKAKRLASTLQERVGAKSTPFVMSFVVLTGTIEELDLTEEHAGPQSVLFLSELLDWIEEKKYSAFVNRPARINPLSCLNAYNLFFGANAGKPRGYNVHGYKPDAQPLWEHPKKLYAEFRAKEMLDTDKLALLRQWDFSALGMDLIGENERGFIGLREQRIYEHVENRNEELSRSLLRPITRSSEADVTRDFVELYALPPRLTRLSEFINSGLSKLTSIERIVLVKAMLQRFADLHDLNVAHRDIGAHCLWVERSAKVVISGFPGAYYPTMETVGTFRDRVKVERASLPEDTEKLNGATPYKRDIFMLGVMAHLILYGERPPKIDGFFVFEVRAEDVYGGVFNTVISQALARLPIERYVAAREMLEAFNEVSREENRQIIELSVFDAYRAKTRVRDYEEHDSPITDDDDLFAFRSTFEGANVLVKEWHGIEPDENKPDLTIRLLSFLERARNLRGASLAGLPVVHDFGLSRRSLLVVQEWIDGETLVTWAAQEKEIEKKLNVARAIANALSQMHDFEWPHGDIKPENIIVTSNHEVRLIDILDFRRSSNDVYSTAYLPSDYKSLSPLERDRYALASVLNEFLFDNGEPLRGLVQVQEEIHRLITERHVSSLEPLINALNGRGPVGAESETPSYQLTIPGLVRSGLAVGKMLGDNENFYLTIEQSRKFQNAKLLHLTGAAARLTFEWHQADRKVTWVSAKPIDLTNLIWAQDKCLERVSVNIVLEDGNRSRTEEIEGALEAWCKKYRSTQNVQFENISDEDTFATVDVALTDDAALGQQIASEVAPIDVEELWNALLDAEEDSLPTATVIGLANKNPQRDYQILVPCQLDSTGFDPDIDDRTWVERQSAEGQWRKCGDLELRDTSLGAEPELAIERWQGKPLKVGDKLRLRSNMESASFTRRTAAVKRILERRSVIPDLISYFQASAVQPMPAEYGRPSDDAMEVYTQGDKRLNESQQEAFCKAIQYGPLSLLQGPPGTGKTWFIASLLHYLVTREGARRILVVSQAHEAVNNALEKAQELFESKELIFDAVRLGHESVISEPIRHLHSSSIEQAYRERFKAEYKERVIALASEFGLPTGFSAEAVKLHIRVGQLIENIRRLRQESLLEEPIKNAASTDLDELRLEAEVRLNSLTETLRDICNREYQYEIGEIALNEVIEELYVQLAERHEIQSPQAVQKLRQLLKMSDDWLKTLGEPAANFVEFLAKSRTVVAGTLVGIGRRAAGVIQNMYDWVVIDEAGRAAPSELAVAMQTGRRILLVGDHKQLPPTFSQEVKEVIGKELGYSQDSKAFVSDFERVFDSAYGTSVGTALREQYRMSPSIGDLVSDVFYEGRLTTGRSSSTLDTSLLPNHLRHEVCWIDTSALGKAGREDSSQDGKEFWNDAEAKIIMDVLHSLLKNPKLISALKCGLHSGDPIIGIICMYSKQRAILQKLKSEAKWIPSELRKLIKIDTVDSYQGKENRIVILSTVRNNPSFNPGFLRSPNRINVAMSRAMERLIIVGATSMWSVKNEHLPLGKVFKKIQSQVANDFATIVSAREFSK